MIEPDLLLIAKAFHAAGATLAKEKEIHGPLPDPS